MANITNNSAINFGTVANGAVIQLTHASATLVDSVKTNRVIWSGTVPNRTLVERDPILIPVGDIDFGLPPGTLMDAWIVDVLTNGIGEYDGGFTIRLGIGDMGNAGTQNEVPGTSGYTAQTGVTLTVEAS